MARDVVMMNNSATCPRCHIPVAMPDVAIDGEGRLHLIRHTFDVLRNADVQRAELEAFRDVLQRAQNRQISETELQAQAARINPTFGSLLIPRDAQTVWAIIGVLVTIIVFLLQNDDPKVVINQQITNNYIAQTMPEVGAKVARPPARTRRQVKPSGKARSKQWGNSRCRCGSGVRARHCCLVRGGKDRLP